MMNIDLQFISLMYLDLYRKLKHIGVGKLITAVPVDKETEDRIRSAAAHIPVSYTHLMWSVILLTV